MVTTEVHGSEVHGLVKVNERKATLNL